ncbi:MAG: HAD family phosphatase [Lachnospiraceae bacterium]|nr:HAD family phosphatase [Lachnospiraceae bacterium]
MKLDRYKAVIFDLDGTLIDSMGIWRDIDIEFFRRYGMDLPVTYQKDIMGMSVIETAKYTKEKYGFTQSPEEMIDEWNEMAYEHYATMIDFKPGADAFLNKLKSMGLKIGIATSNSRYLFSAIYDKLGFERYIDAYVTGEDVVSGKPEPECYIKCANALEVEPSECLIFEDIIQGLTAGRKAGADTCAVYDEHSKEGWTDLVGQADYCIDSFEQLI